jgi:hypothetical protein
MARMPALAAKTLARLSLGPNAEKTLWANTGT